SSVAFSSDAADLASGSGAGFFVHDLATAQTMRVATTGFGFFNVALSGDGKLLAFTGPGGGVLDRTTGITRPLAGARIALAADGHTVAYETFGGGSLVVLHLDSGQSFTLSGNGAFGGVGDYPALSSDGSVVAFGSMSSNLVLGDTNNLEDVFTH